MGRRLFQAVMLCFLLIHLLLSPYGFLHPPPVTGERSTTFENAVDNIVETQHATMSEKCEKI